MRVGRFEDWYKRCDARGERGFSVVWVRRIPAGHARITLVSTCATDYDILVRTTSFTVIREQKSVSCIKYKSEA